MSGLNKVQKKRSMSTVVIQHMNPVTHFKFFCQACAGSFIFWALIAILTLIEPVLCYRYPRGINLYAQLLVLLASTVLYVIQLVGVATREWDKIIMIEAMTSLQSISIPKHVQDFSLLKLFIFFTAEGEYIMEFACLLGGWLTIFVWPGIAVLRCFRVFRLLWFYEVEIFKSTTMYYMSPIVGKVFVNRGFKVLKFAIKSLTALGNELFRLTNETRGALLLMLIFFYSAYVIGAALWVETDGDNGSCLTVGSCTYTLMRLTFFDGDGFDFAFFLTNEHRIMFCFVMMYMCLTSFGILNGLVGIFGTAIAQASDLAFNDDHEDEQKKLFADDDSCSSESSDDLDLDGGNRDGGGVGDPHDLIGAPSFEGGGAPAMAAAKERKAGETELDGINGARDDITGTGDRARGVARRLVRTGTSQSHASNAPSPRPSPYAHPPSGGGAAGYHDDGVGLGHEGHGDADDEGDNMSALTTMTRAEQEQMKMRVAAALGGKSKFAQRQLMRNATVGAGSHSTTKETQARHHRAAAAHALGGGGKDGLHLDDLVKLTMAMKTNSVRWKQKSGKFHLQDDGTDLDEQQQLPVPKGGREQRIFPTVGSPDRAGGGGGGGWHQNSVGTVHAAGAGAGNYDGNKPRRAPVSLFNAKGGKSARNLLTHSTTHSPTGAGAGGAATQKDVNLLLNNIHALSRKVDQQNDMIVALYANIQFLNGQLQQVHPELQQSAEIIYPDLKPSRRFSQHAVSHLPLEQGGNTNNPLKSLLTKTGTNASSATASPHLSPSNSPRRGSFNPFTFTRKQHETQPQQAQHMQHISKPSGDRPSRSRSSSGDAGDGADAAPVISNGALQELNSDKAATTSIMMKAEGGTDNVGDSGSSNGGGGGGGGRGGEETAAIEGKNTASSSSKRGHGGSDRSGGGAGDADVTRWMDSDSDRHRDKKHVSYSIDVATASARAQGGNGSSSGGNTIAAVSVIDEGSSEPLSEIDIG